MSQNYDPKYDEDQITFGFLKKILGDDNLKNISKNEKNLNLIKNYGSTPFPPYTEGDTWTTLNKVYKCIKSRKIGSFNMNDWVEIYNKDTNTALSNNFQFLSSIELYSSPDGKVETYYSIDDPSVFWDDTEKSLHVGDYYQNSLTNKTYIFTQDHLWKERAVASIIFDSINGHRNIFIKRPISYTAGDIWKLNNLNDISLFADCVIGDFFKCTKSNDIFSSDDWERVTDELSIKANLYSNNGFMISSNNILTNLQYSSSGLYNGYGLLGFNRYYTVNGTIDNYSDISLDVDLPDNFKIVSAYLTIFHTPVYWSYWDENISTSRDVWGHSRNLKLYKMDTQNNFKLFMAFANEYRCEFNNSEMKEIPNAFKTVSYTPNNSRDTTITKRDSINLKNHLNPVGKTKLIIRSSNSVPTTQKGIAEQTGMAKIIVNILGYINPKEG